MGRHSRVSHPRCIGELRHTASAIGRVRRVMSSTWQSSPPSLPSSRGAHVSDFERLLREKEAFGRCRTCGFQRYLAKAKHGDQARRHYQFWKWRGPHPKFKTIRIVGMLVKVNLWLDERTHKRWVSQATGCRLASVAASEQIDDLHAANMLS